MTFKRFPKFHMRLHQCRRCNGFFKDAGKFSKICPKCRLPIGTHTGKNIVRRKT